MAAIVPRIALIHALSASLEPIEEAFRRLWPEAERINLMDDALSVDRRKTTDLAEALSRRIGALADYAVAANAKRPGATLESLAVSEAMTALQAGDVATHNRLLAQSAERLAGCDVVMLAQFSTSRAKDACEAALGRPVLTPPNAAVRVLRRALGAA